MVEVQTLVLHHFIPDLIIYVELTKTLDDEPQPFSIHDKIPNARSRVISIVTNDSLQGLAAAASETIFVEGQVQQFRSGLQHYQNHNKLGGRMLKAASAVYGHPVSGTSWLLLPPNDSNMAQKCIILNQPVYMKDQNFLLFCSNFYAFAVLPIYQLAQIV
ncbi:hypothetical protein CHS0354_020188 [Potamilus streckersoni]|uniref:Uncharacterized protein n=1 Tax=Potamilus streckersoni TaxID=2493646 RepID=A0AAE0VWQ2_9BIVA|nr:hypothetical protein CHS0354_020188 [Potamilus streckersoni]